MRPGAWRYLAGVILLAAAVAAGFWLGRKEDRPEPKPALGPTSETTAQIQATGDARPAQAGSLEAPAATTQPQDASSAAEDENNRQGLERYFKALNDSNSVVYEVRTGDNLTRIARLFGVRPGLIQAANLLKSDRIFPGQKLRIPKARWTLLVNKERNILYLEADGTAIRHYPIATGKDQSTPEGTFKILNHLKNPTWYYEGKVVPPESPENPLGTRWMGFDKEGYGLHGTSKPEEIGQFATLGCVRMLNEDIETLFEILPVGTEVTIVARRD